MQTFSFPYYTAKNSLSADDFTIKAQSGPLIKREFPAGNLQHFYRFSNNQYEALYATYNDETGKTKKIQLFSNLGESQFADMIAYLEKKYPQSSLNHLPVAEALKTMHVANPNKWVPIVVFVLLSVSMSIFFYPMLRHYFDKGQAQTTAETFSPAGLSTRNISISGYLLDVGVKETITSSKSSSSHSSTYIPMVGESWKEGDPIKVILGFPSLSGSGFDEVIKQTEFKGVVRDIWWEGISSDNLDFLKEKYNLSFPETPVLIEVTDTYENDGFIIWVWGGTMIFILVLVIIVSVKMNRK